MRETKSINNLLQEHLFFSDFTSETVEYIAGCGKNVHFAPNEYLTREDEDADYFYVIKSGKVAVQLHDPGKGDMVISTLGKDDIAGFSWIFPPYKYTFDIKALGHTSAVAIDGKCIRSKCEKDKELGYQLMKQFASLAITRLSNLRMQLLDVYGSSS